MTLSVVAAMFREQFLRTGWQLCVIVAIAVLFEVSLKIAQGTDVDGIVAEGYADMYGGAGVALALTLASAILLVLYHNDSDLRLGLPNYVLRLPMPTWAIVLVRTIFNLATVAIVLLITGLAYDWAAGGERLELVFWLGLLAFLAAQTISWAAGERGWFVVLYGILLLIVVWALGTSFPALQEVTPSPSLFLFSLVPAFAICWYGIARQRRGGRALADQLVDAAVDMRPSDRDVDFVSPGAAQRWLEWRLTGGVHTAIALLITLSVCTYMWFAFHAIQWRRAAIGADYQWESSVLAVLRELPEVAVSATILGAIVGSVIVFITHLRLETGAFLFTRPLSTRAIAEARTRVALRNVAIAGGFVFVAAAISLAADLSAPTGSPYYSLGVIVGDPLTGSVALGLSFIGLLGWFWSLTWIYVGGLLALTVFLGALINRAFGISIDDATWNTFWAVPGLLLSIAVIWSVYRAQALHLLSRKSLVVGVAFSIVVMLAVLFHSDPLDPLDAVQYNFGAAVPFLFLPLAPFGLVPLSLHWMRHR